MINLPTSDTTFVQLVTSLPENLPTFPTLPITTSEVLEIVAPTLYDKLAETERYGLDFHKQKPLEQDTIIEVHQDKREVFVLVVVYRSTTIVDLFSYLKYFPINKGAPKGVQPIYEANPDQWNECRFVRLGQDRLQDYLAKLTKSTPPKKSFFRLFKQ